MDEIREDFYLKNDRMADWAIRQIAQAEAEFERLKSWYKSQLEKAQQDKDEEVARLNGLLRQYLETVPAKETKTMYKYSLPSGDMVLSKPKEDYTCTDEQKLLEWCKMNDQQLIKTTYKPMWADVKKRLSYSPELGVIDSETGMIVDGVALEHKDAEFKVRMRGESENV